MVSEIRGLYALCDNVRLAEELLIGGAPILQLRIKGCDPDNLRRRSTIARAITDLKKRYEFTFLINDDLLLARELGAAGVHVGADDPPVAHCRRVLGPSRLIGYSAHSLTEAYAAEQAGADYVAFGAIFPSPSKGPDHPVQGPDKLKELVRTVNVPIVAIGGINQDNVQDVLSTGAAAVAMISALSWATNVPGATRAMLNRMRAPLLSP